MMVIRLDLKIICVTKAVVPLTTEKKERKVYIPHRSKIYLHKSVRRIRSGMEQPTPKKERVQRVIILMFILLLAYYFILVVMLQLHFCCLFAY